VVLLCMDSTLLKNEGQLGPNIKVLSFSPDEQHTNHKSKNSEAGN